MSKGRRFNPDWPSAQADTPEARRIRKRDFDARQRERKAQVNVKLEPLGLTFDTLIDAILQDTVSIVKL